MKTQQWTQMMIDKLIYSLSQELCVDESYIQEIIAYKLPNETTDWINHLSEFDLSSFMKKYKDKVYSIIESMYKDHPDLNIRKAMLIDEYYVFKNMVMINLMMDLRYPRSFVEPCIEEIEEELLKPYYEKYKNREIKFYQYANSTFKGNKIGPTLKKILTESHKNCINTVKW